VPLQGLQFEEHHGPESTTLFRAPTEESTRPSLGVIEVVALVKISQQTRLHRVPIKPLLRQGT
jgi:hypothetical protein